MERTLPPPPLLPSFPPNTLASSCPYSFLLSLLLPHIPTPSSCPQLQPPSSFTISSFPHCFSPSVLPILPHVLTFFLISLPPLSLFSLSLTTTVFKNTLKRYWFWFDEKTCSLKYYRNQETYTLGINEPLGSVSRLYNIVSSSGYLTVLLLGWFTVCMRPSQRVASHCIWSQRNTPRSLHPVTMQHTTLLQTVHNIPTNAWQRIAIEL